MAPRTKIEYKDISFIVQGPVVGAPTDPYEKRHTYQCLQSIRKTFPGATIILSTWQDSNVTDLDYDVLVRNEDPGQVVLADIANTFRQVVSTLGGLKQCKTRYAVKTRQDLVFTHDHFLRYFTEYNALPFDPAYKLLHERIVALASANPRRGVAGPFWLSDWFHFGRTEDLLNVFDIPLIRGNVVAPDSHGVVRKMDSLLSGEQYMWFSFLSKYRKIPFTHMMDTGSDNIATSEKYFANNCIFLTARRAGIKSLKSPGAIYARTPALSDNGLYTFTDYKRLLNRYAGARLCIIPNPIEELIYAVAYPLRGYLGNRHPELLNRIRRLLKPVVQRKK
jgi:hypothetical protein